MNSNLLNSADAIGLFCRLHMNSKRELPIRPSEMGVLIFTQKQRHPVTPLMISHMFKIAKPSVTSIVNVLVKKEYLMKHPSTTDGRSYTLSVTQNGNILVEETFKEYLKLMAHLQTKMGERKFEEFIESIELANKILEEVI